MNDPNTEYIELTNIGKQTDQPQPGPVHGRRGFHVPELRSGPGRLLPGGQGPHRRSGTNTATGLPVAGQYAGSLSNAGEQIELRDAAGTIICRFEYKDSWFPKTDGGGYSLTVKDPVTTDPNSLSNAGAWRASSVAGGTPGRADLP